ncbi:MAG: hypothetical protein IT314_13750 [Anaerolineales bacterium]|nr:hypothetical protein [Anaerolineales bacterium]
MIKDEIVIIDGQDTGEGKWSQHPELLRSVVFTRVRKRPVWCVANVDESTWTVTLNDFPDEPSHTVFIDDKPIMSFNNWPAELWTIESSER